MSASPLLHHSPRVLKEFNGCIQVSEINTVWSIILILLCNENICHLLCLRDLYSYKILLGKVFTVTVFCCYMEGIFDHFNACL